jgi:fatty acid desaturase
MRTTAFSERAAGAATAPIPAAGNLSMAALVLGANLACGLAMPLLLPTAGPWLLLALAPLVALTVPHWALIHEAVHGHLHPERRLNEALGRTLGVFFGAPFAVLRFGHLSHHALNSNPAERPELYDPAATPRWRARAVYYLRLFVGVYLAEVASALAFLLPRRLLAPVLRRTFYEGSPEAGGMAERAERQLLLDGRRLSQVRLDGLLALLWLGACLWLYGASGWWAFGLAVLGRGAVVSFMDNAPHYAGPLGDAGQGYDTRAPRLLAPLILNTNLHGTHHRHPGLPWTALPRAFAADGTAYAGGYLAVPWRQLAGPIPRPSPEARAGRPSTHAPSRIPT